MAVCRPPVRRAGANIPGCNSGGLDRGKSVFRALRISDHGHSARFKGEPAFLPQVLHPPGATNPSGLLLPADSPPSVAVILHWICGTQFLVLGEPDHPFWRRVRVRAVVVAGSGRAFLHLLARGGS